MSGPFAGSYDPVQGTFLSPVRGETASGEPLTDSWEPYCKRYVRFLQKQSMDANREQLVAKQQVSRSLLVFRCRRDSKTESIQPDMKFFHRGRMWNIVGIDVIDYVQDEVQFLAENVLTPITWTPS
jgi:hypothetical protein